MTKKQAEDMRELLKRKDLYAFSDDLELASSFKGEWFILNGYEEDIFEEDVIKDEKKALEYMVELENSLKGILLEFFGITINEETLEATEAAKLILELQAKLKEL